MQALDLNNLPIPFPRAAGDGRIIVDELCYCGNLRSKHSGVGPVFGHGACPAGRCKKFTWKSPVYGRVAFAATMPQSGGFGLGLVGENENGYRPRPELGTFETWEDAHARAADLNEQLGLSKREAVEIVASSMRGTARDE